MKTIILITCVAPKLNYPAAAKDLYQGSLFKELLQYADQQQADKVFILSGKHHLLHLDTIIAPYDVNLNEVSDLQLRNWADKVVVQLREETKLLEDHFVLLTNPTYSKYLLPHFQSFSTPIPID